MDRKIYTCLLIKIREKIMNKGKERKKCYVDLKKNLLFTNMYVVDV